jgi:transcriptional regulator with XRE-family HTH domain
MRKPKSTSTHPTIGPKIEWHRRHRLGWTLRELSRRSGVTYTLIGRWERQDADPDFGQASKLAHALGISVETLWDTSPPPRDVQK